MAVQGESARPEGSPPGLKSTGDPSMRRILLATACVVAALIGALYLFNASWLAPRPPGERYFIAHRGVHQEFPHGDIANDACTATMIYPPTHDFLENTIPAAAAAFAAGAEIVEIDIHPTTDGEFALWHDWTLDCRTDGEGVTRLQPMAYLRTLDAGYGYTADDGATYPLRGKGVGMIPTLGEMLDAFPARRFLINFKSNDPAEADLLSAYLAGRGEDLSRLAVYGGAKPTARFGELHPDTPGYSKASLIRCLSRYLALGWSGRVPAACRDTIVIVPKNYARLMWGWPRRFQNRMAAAGTDVWLIGDWNSGDATVGVDTPEDLAGLPDDFTGGVWTNRIEAVGTR